MALNLTGVDRDEVQRGQWVVKDPSHRAHLSGRRVSVPAGGCPRAAHPRLARAGGSRDRGDPGQGGAGRPGDPAPGRILLRPAAVRGAGAGVSRGPLHPALADAGDHHRGGAGVRPGAAQARHRAPLARAPGAAGGGGRRMPSPLSCWRSLPAGPDPRAGWKGAPTYGGFRRQERGGRAGLLADGRALPGGGPRRCRGRARGPARAAPTRAPGGPGSASSTARRCCRSSR